MARLVMKFGGTSVGDVERIQNVARLVKAEVDAGHEVIVVVSAMSGETNRLVGLVNDIAPLHDTREYDVVVSAGEQVSIGLVSLALQQLGVQARSWLGWQLPIDTNSVHGAARMEAISPDAINQKFKEGQQVAVVAGFQGVGSDNRITTLGRGGSDTSAVAVAAGLSADRCDIYTDVDGVYTCDPRIVPKARKLDRISYEEMLEMASLGSKVLQTRSVELAMAHKVPLQVRSSFDPDKPGTIVCDEDEIMEKEIVSGIACSRDEAKITLVKVADKPGIAASIFGHLAEAAVNVDMIVQNISDDGENTDVTFTIGRADVARTVKLLEAQQGSIGYERLVSDDKVVKVSVIGVGMRSHAGVALTMFETLAEKGINIEVITTSEIKISVLIDEEYAELAIRALHTSYGLDSE